SEPWMAQLAFDHGIGATAARDTVALKGQISKSIQSFFDSATKVPSRGSYTARRSVSKPSYGNPRLEYEKASQRAYSLLEQGHQQRVQEQVQKVSDAGYPDLARQMYQTNQRAVQYTAAALPKSKTAKSSTTLRPLPIPRGLDLNE